MFFDKTILITGGTGSWGNELTKQLMEKYSPREIRIYSRGERKQAMMKRDFENSPKIKFIIGDVRDYERLDESCRKVDYVFHLAALKHVPICESNVSEAKKTNIMGTQNVIRASIKNSVKKVIYISSDKAVDPLNFYGMTKAVGERLILAANNLTEDTSFVCIRAGNVLGTSESVVPVFRKQILNTNKITITDGEMTRFYLNLKQAISLIFKASEESVGGEIFVTNMPAVKINDLAEVMIKELGGGQTEKVIIGKRPGEKMHELLVSRDESERTFKLGEYFLILPHLEIEKIKNRYDTKNMVRVDFEEFSSVNAKRMNFEEIKQILDNENWLTKDEHDTDVLYKNKEQILDFFKNVGWIKKEDL
ncbi:UDP-N-acetylglucosamine 4,6-dehydratase [Candidatus Pacearchaeota archaeon CG10_big_fil_rev_8_21_14_0_10_34_12]|nr:MAG: UDP-N-acetylglucosamine 4,6-dehydratase [Candidatus Pacearchaeota archaeon CG10_big_fil_rev_8_21_14_0_10_34_12]